MRRWHSPREQVVMFRRWKVEMEKHGYDWRNPPCDRDACHCAKGIGSMRKASLSGHHSHCLLCNGDKYLRKARQNRRERAVGFELALMD